MTLGTRLAATVTILLTLVGSISALRAQEPPPPPPEAAPPVAAPPEPEPPQPPAPPVAAPPEPEPPQPPAPPAAAPPPEAAAAASEAPRGTPPQLSLTDGEVSFWRPGAEDWAPAQINTPLAPGDALYAAPGANLELQIGPRAFVRAGAETQLTLENQEPDFLQLSITAGHVAVDLRRLSPGQTIELDTPNAAFTLSGKGYYRIDLSDNTTTFVTRRGGQAVLTPAGGEALSLVPNEEVVVEGTDNPQVATYAAPAVDAWDRWNQQRTDHLLRAASARYVPQGVYGVDALDQYGQWRPTRAYGRVWVPTGVAADWAPYSTGRWVWDPYYGWTWVDEAPWGWAPYHYGRWVVVGGLWAWAPGPIVAAPVYAPALVAFFGGEHFGVSIGFGVPAVGWVALGWGEPLVPWWGHAGFIGHPWWGGWGGPHVVNNVVINRTTIINVTNITKYRNVDVRNAVVATREDRFGRGMPDHMHVRHVDPRIVRPVHGALAIRPVADSLVPRVGRGVRPPEAAVTRPVVATRPPRDTAAALRAQGLQVPSRAAAAPRIVAAPHGAPARRAPAARQRPEAPIAPQGRALPGQPAPRPVAPAGRPPAPAARPAPPAPRAAQRAPRPAPPAPAAGQPARRPAQPAPRVAPPAPHAAPRAPRPAPPAAAPAQPERRPAQAEPRVAPPRPAPHAPRAPQPAAPPAQPERRPARPEPRVAPPHAAPHVPRAPESAAPPAQPERRPAQPEPRVAPPHAAPHVPRAPESAAPPAQPERRPAQAEPRSAAPYRGGQGDTAEPAPGQPHEVPR